MVNHKGRLVHFEYKVLIRVPLLTRVPKFPNPWSKEPCRLPNSVFPIVCKTILEPCRPVNSPISHSRLLSFPLWLSGLSISISSIRTSSITILIIVEKARLFSCAAKEKNSKLWIKKYRLKVQKLKVKSKKLKLQINNRKSKTKNKRLEIRN